MAYLREKLEIDIMTQRNPYEVRRINEILEIMVDVLNSKAKTIRKRSRTLKDNMRCGKINSLI